MKKILIVEDDLLQVFFLKRTVTHLGHEVVGSTTLGDQATEMATRLHPDIIFMDINLGGKLNGVETADQILKKVDCFIIYITGSADQTLISQASQTPPGTILSKPITGEMLKHTIDSYFGVAD